MSSDYLAILQLSAPAGPKQLERAYRLSRARYERLTERGPLRFYRQDLLADTERAYQHLKRQMQASSAVNSKYRKISTLRQGPSAVAQQAAQRGGIDYMKGAVKSQVKKGSIFSAEAVRLKSRYLHELRHMAGGAGAGGGMAGKGEAGLSEREKALIEDEFCREVIHRLEGEMIRFDSRRELLQKAREEGIHLFRANMLIAQIVEAVRQHKLYEPSAAERQISQSFRPRRGRLKAAWAAGAVILAVVIDLLLIRYLD